MKVYKLYSYAKINLNLNVIKKLKNKNLHAIESLVVFINLSDLIEIKRINYHHHRVVFQGKFSKGIKKKNSVTNLLNFLDKKKLLGEKKYKIFIKKNIPQQSGMGGGSMNAASILNFFYKKGIINLTNVRLCSKKIGSDVLLGINKKPKILFSDGKIKETKKNFNYWIVLIKPLKGCSTKEIYSKNKSFSKKEYKYNKNFQISESLILKGKNDLEKAAFQKYPLLKHLKNKLLKNQKAKFVRMTGSGSTLVVYFKSKVYAKNAFKLYKRKLNNCWCFLTKII